MSLGTSLLKHDGVGKRKHKLVDDYPSACGVSPKRISIASDIDRSRVALLPSHAVKQSVRVCALTIGSWDASNIIAQSGADIVLCRKKQDGASSWKVEGGYDVNVIETGEATRLAFRSLRLAVGRQWRFDRTSDLLAKQVQESLFGDAFLRSATFAHLRAFATSRAAIVELRDTYSGAQFVVCVLDSANVSGNFERLPVRVVETCALLNEAQKMLIGGSGQSSLLLFVGDDESSGSPVLDEIVEVGYPNSDTITHLQRVRIRHVEAASSASTSQTQGALIDALWHFFQHSVVGLRRVARAQRRFQLWYTTANPESMRLDVESSDYAAIDFNSD